jgi:magnesium chelatase family protein
MAPAEPSAAVRARVTRAREIQRDRFANCHVQTNARMSATSLRTHAALDDACRRLLATALVRLQLSARGFTRIVKVARTIADLEGCAAIQPPHVAEATQYRNLDRPLT